MKLHILGNKEIVKEIMENFPQVEWITTDRLEEAIADTTSEIIINLNDHAIAADYRDTNKIVLVNAVSETLSDYHHGENIVRINGWNGFLTRKIWEMSGKSNEVLDTFASTCGLTYKWLPDVPGFVSPRVISMIINEAFFALEQSVSTEPDIDIALKLGTNYPMGPFEWAEKIGLHRVKELLEKLTLQSDIYKPSPLLFEQSKEI
jgi:3-hydroxybutyryl-CoA dehydrogenase